ncbi:interleukin-18-like [Rana temporaria]|uniref:interleukin-18-like n=1 Tax=Rana temporaria TaxID=8407 RepID=UPI001AAE06FF|nr:interleukin-18-like [Rana temporaria]
MSCNSCGESDMSEILCGHYNLEDGLICFRYGEVDAWKKAKDPIVCIITDYFNEYLTAEYRGPNDVNVEFLETKNSLKENTEQKIFMLEKYKTTVSLPGLSVVFTVSFQEKKFHLYCTLEKEITFKPGQGPIRIEGNKSDVIFVARMFSEGHNDAYKFESSLHKDHFLAAKEENGKRVLYLKLCPTDVVDESVRLHVHLQN